MTRRIAAGLVALIVLTLAGVVVPLGFVTAANDRQLFADRATATASAAAAAAEEHLSSDAGQLTRGRFVLPDPSRDGDAVQVYDRSGRLVSQEGAAVSPGAQTISTALRGHATVTWPSHADDTLLVAVPVQGDNAVVGALALTRPSGSLDRQVFVLWRNLGLAALGALCLAGALAVALSRWVARPLRHLEDAAGELGSGALTTRAAVDSGPPEIRALGARFNDMADRLENLVAGHRAFVGDVSHQLRTPLATMRLRLDLLRDDVDAATQGEIDQTLGELHRFSRILDGLLAVARAEQSSPAAVSIDVAHVLDERTVAWRPVAADAGIELDVQHPAKLIALSTPGHLEQVLDNLLANALDAASAGGTIRLHGERLARTVRVTVADSGPGMPDEQKRRAFRRFWTRADPEDPGGRSGTGLGLAIVHRLITSDGGHVELADADLGGLGVHVDLPAVSPRSDSPAAQELHDTGSGRTVT